MSKTKVNEYGDKITKTEFCQGVLMFGSIIGLMMCACLRGCEEIQKKKNKAIQKNQIEQKSSAFPVTNRVSYIVLPQKQR